MNRDGLEDPLEDQGMVAQQLDQLSTIGRYEYKKTCTLLVQLFDESAQRYQELVSAGQGNTNINLAIQEGNIRSIFLYKHRCPVFISVGNLTMVTCIS